MTDIVERLRGCLRFDEERPLIESEIERAARDAAAEIERLRGLLQEEQSDDLTTAALYGFHQRDDEVAGLKAEIERLREEGKKDYEGMREFQRKFIDADHEIERLRGEIKTLKLEMRSLLQVTVGTLTDVEIQRDYGMLGWSVVNRCEELTSVG